MVKSTLVYRLSDGLPLAESSGTGASQMQGREWERQKQQARTLIKKMAESGIQQGSHQSQHQRTSYESGPAILHCVTVLNSSRSGGVGVRGEGVVFIAICDKGFAKRLAYGYLEELAREFDSQFHNQVASASRPYEFIKFDTFMQRTRKMFMEQSSSGHLSKINEDLADIQQIMTKNIQDVLGMGDTLNNMSKLSSTLKEESKKYNKKSAALARQALIRQYVPYVVIGSVIFAVMGWKLLPFFL